MQQQKLRDYEKPRSVVLVGRIQGERVPYVKNGGQSRVHLRTNRASALLLYIYLGGSIQEEEEEVKKKRGLKERNDEVLDSSCRR